MTDTTLKLFQDTNIRTQWDADAEKWYFSIVDVIAALTESADPSAYWRKLKQRLKEEGNETASIGMREKVRTLGFRNQFLVWFGFWKETSQRSSDLAI